MSTDHRSPEAQAYRVLYKSARWASLRKLVLNRNPLCTRCQARGHITAATVVNHRTPHKGDLTLFWSIDNLEAVCKPCHDGVIQGEEVRGYSNEIDVTGWPTDQWHPANR